MNGMQENYHVLEMWVLCNMAMNPSHLGWLEAHKQKAYGPIQGQY
jgi:hypothetical protein